jgi:hypothetical protein
VEGGPVSGKAGKIEIHIREGTAEWRAWQRHLQDTTGRGTPVDKRGGWKLPRLP